MNERDYLDHNARVTADSRTATIESLNDDGSYMVRMIGPRALRRASPSNPLDFFTAGQRVIISEPSASRTVIGSEAVIQSRAPRDQRGLSGSVPAESLNYHDRAVILSIDPDPLVVVAGGEPGVQTIIGRGLTVPAEYVSRAAKTPPLPAPDVADAEPPIVEPERVVMTIEAAADSPTGIFSLEIGSATARDALQIVASDLPQPPWLIVSGVLYFPDDSFRATLWVLEADTLAVVRVITIAGDSTSSVAIATAGSTVYWITREGPDYSLHVVRPATGVITSSTVLPASVSAYSESHLVIVDNRLLLGSVGDPPGRGLWSFALDGSDGQHEWIDVSSGSTDHIGVAADSDAVFLTGDASTRRLSRTTFALEASSFVVKGERVHAIRTWAPGTGYGGYTGQVCVVGGGGDNVRWLAAANLAIAQTFHISFGQFRGPVQIEDHIYFVAGSNDTLYRASLDGTSVAAVDVLPGFFPIQGSVSTDGIAVYYHTSSRQVARASVEGVVEATSVALDSLGDYADIDLQQTLYVAG